jgi:hypothetical protein
MTSTSALIQARTGMTQSDLLRKLADSGPLTLLIAEQVAAAGYHLDNIETLLPQAIQAAIRDLTRAAADLERAAPINDLGILGSNGTKIDQLAAKLCDARVRLNACLALAIRALDITPPQNTTP